MLIDELLQLKEDIKEYKNIDILVECVKDRLDTSIKLYSDDINKNYKYVIRDRTNEDIIKALKREIKHV